MKGRWGKSKSARRRRLPDVVLVVSLHGSAPASDKSARASVSSFKRVHVSHRVSFG
jgi:hypothetical protein